jgi:NTP pyrophosphatase (non-canonical NTP hydrolase)
MKFDEWLTRSQACMLNDLPLACKALGLGGEAGEVQELIKKQFRGDHKPDTEFRENLVGELGDVMWYVAALAEHYEVPMEAIFTKNVTKLERRKSNDTIKGSGSNR